MTGFTNGEEENVHPATFVPVHTENDQKRVGGNYETAPDWQSFTIVDGRLIINQNPASSIIAANALVRGLSRA